MFFKLLTLALLFSTTDVVEARRSKYNKNPKQTVNIVKSTLFCIKHFGTYKYLYTDIDQNGKKVMMLKEKKFHDPFDEKMSWKVVWNAGMENQIGFLENNGRQVDFDPKTDEVTWHEQGQSPQVKRGFMQFIQGSRMNQDKIKSFEKQLFMTANDDMTVIFSPDTATDSSQDFAAVDCSQDRLVNASLNFRYRPTDEQYVLHQLNNPGLDRHGIDIHDQAHPDYEWTAQELMALELKKEEDHEERKRDMEHLEEQGRIIGAKADGQLKILQDEAQLATQKDAAQRNYDSCLDKKSEQECSDQKANLDEKQQKLQEYQDQKKQMYLDHEEFHKREYEQYNESKKVYDAKKKEAWEAKEAKRKEEEAQKKKAYHEKRLRELALAEEKRKEQERKMAYSHEEL